MTRPVKEIAAEIDKDWQKVSYAARPYLNAMFDINRVEDYYYSDSGKSIVRYFLANASTWRGETAKRIKAELNKMVK